jgi:hypothetical protein
MNSVHPAFKWTLIPYAALAFTVTNNPAIAAAISYMSQSQNETFDTYIFAVTIR